MSVTYGFYNSLNGDRKYDATQISSMFDGLIIDGVFASIGTCFVVNADTGNTVNVGIGKAWFNRTWTLNDAVLPLEAPISEVLLDRIDAVVLEVDTLERVNSIKFVKGVPSSSPVNPTLASGPTLFQYPLCYIYRPAGSTEITQAQITNMVGSEATPFVTGILQTTSLNEIFSLWQDEYGDWYYWLLDNMLYSINTNAEAIETHKNDYVKHMAYATASGTNDYTVSISGITALVEGLSVKIKFSNANSGASTLNINGLGAKTIKKSNGDELSSGFIKAGQILHLVYDGVNFQLLGEGGEYKEISDINIMVKCDESADYGGTIYALATDGTYLYVGGGSTNKVWKIDPSNMSKVAESADYGDIIYVLATDGTYLYVGVYNTNKVWKIDPSNMSKVAESADYGGNIRALATDGTYLYVGGGSTKKVWKIDPSNMSKVAESANYGGTIYALATDGTYLYVGGSSTKKVWKIDPSTMNKVAESADYGGTIRVLATDGAYLYVGGSSTEKVWKIDPSTMNKVAESADYGGIIYVLATDGTYLYVGGTSTKKVWKIDPSNMNKVVESANYGDDIQALATDGAYLYVGGYGTNKVWKMTNTVYIKEV